MTSLNIQQNTQSSEVVANAVIEKLYNLAITSTVEDENSSFSMSLQGNISVSAAFEDSVLYLRQKFPNLTINVPENKYYIRFRDPVIDNFCKSVYGDGIGVTKTQAAGVPAGSSWTQTSMTSDIKSQVTSLYDLQYFTNLNNYGTFPVQGFTNAIDITFPQITITYSGRYTHFVISECNNISSVNYNGATFYSLGEGFIDVIQDNDAITDWSNSLLPAQNDLTHIRLFDGWRKLQKIIFREGITHTEDKFTSMPALQYVEYPTTIRYIGDWFQVGRNGSTGYVVVIKATTPPAMYYSPNNLENGGEGWSWHRFPTAIYVPDSAVNAYKNVTPLTISSDTNANQLGWCSPLIIEKIKPLSELPQLYLDMGTVTQADIDRV